MKLLSDAEPDVFLFYKHIFFISSTERLSHNVVDFIRYDNYSDINFPLLIRDEYYSVVDTASNAARLDQMTMARTEQPSLWSHVSGQHQTYPEPGDRDFSVLSEDDMDCVRPLYCYLYPDIVVGVLEFVQSLKYVIQAGLKFEAQDHCGGGHGIIMAKWARRDSQTGGLVIDPSATVRPAIVRDLFLSTITLRSGNKRRRVTHVIARMEWFKNHPQQHHFGSDTEVWATDFESQSEASFMPLHRALSKCAITTDIVKFTSVYSERVCIVVPLHS